MEQYHFGMHVLSGPRAEHNIVRNHLDVINLFGKYAANCNVNGVAIVAGQAVQFHYILLTSETMCLLLPRCLIQIYQSVIEAY